MSFNWQPLPWWRRSMWWKRVVWWRPRCVHCKKRFSAMRPVTQRDGTPHPHERWISCWWAWVRWGIPEVCSWACNDADMDEADAMDHSADATRYVSAGDASLRPEHVRGE